MLSRHSLWTRVGGESFWPLAWALAAASSLPWIIPETWNGDLSRPAMLIGWVGVALTAPLIRSRRLCALPLAWVLAWGTLGGLRKEAIREARLPTGWVRLQGRINAPWTLRGNRLTGLLKVDQPGILSQTELQLSLPADGAAPPAPGTPVALHADLVPIDPGPAFLAERPLWRSRDEGHARRVQLTSALVMEILGPPQPSLLLGLQVWTRARFDALALPPGPGRDLWGALVLGLPPAQDDLFSRFAESGTLHTLVVSGLQISLVIAALELLFRRWLGRRAGLVALGGGLLYAAVVGFSAPVWRGVAMGAAWVLGRSSGWRLPPVLTLHGALLAWLMGHPAAGAEPGFLLAWWALLGLLWGAEALQGLLAPLLGRLAGPAAKAIAPWLSTLPLLALFHGGTPIWGAAANLLLVPLVGVLTPLALALTVLPLPGATLLTRAMEWIATGFLTPFMGIRPLATTFLLPWILLLLGWLLLAQRWSRFQKSRALAVVLAVGSVGLLATRGVGADPKSLSLEAVDVGQGDALLLRQPNGDATLIDSGPSPWSARRLARVLSRRGVREPVHLLLTHPHGDHAGGWATLARLWPMASVGTPVLADSQGAWAGWRPPEIPPISELARGDHWQRGQAGLAVRWPPKPFLLPDANMVSLVLRVTWPDRELWLMGDALTVQEQDLLTLGDPPPGPAHRLLKLGHHGSRSSSSPDWLQAVAPEVVLATAGRRNRFGHPHPETLGTLQALRLAAPLNVGTARGVRVEAAPEGWTLETGDGGRSFIPFRKIPNPEAQR